jgi:hypothetical protein
MPANTKKSVNGKSPSNANADKKPSAKTVGRTSGSEHADDMSAATSEGQVRVARNGHSMRNSDKATRDNADAKASTRPDKCLFNAELASKIDKYGLIPLAVFSGVSIVCSFFNVYSWGRNLLNVLFMSIAALSLALYEGVVLYTIKKCNCAYCKSRRRTSLIFFIIGATGFIAGLISFAMYR